MGCGRFYDKNDRKIHGESNVWSTAQRQKMIDRFDVCVGFQLNHRSVGCG